MAKTTIKRRDNSNRTIIKCNSTGFLCLQTNNNWGNFNGRIVFLVNIAVTTFEASVLISG